jgi:uncharacterized OsmC-like protein
MSIAEAVADATRYLTDHPDVARYRDTAAVAFLLGGLRVDVRGLDGSNVQTDMPTGIGGTATAPSPGWLFRAAIAACVTSLIAIRAAVLGWELEVVQVDVDSESDDRGILGMADDIPAAPFSIRIAVGMSVPGKRIDEIEALVQAAINHCPVADACLRPVPLELMIWPGPEPEAIKLP